MKRRYPYIPWFVLDGTPTRSPIEAYGPENKTYFTMRVSHGGNLIDRPEREYRRSIVSYFESVNVDRLDLDEFLLISRHLGYKTVGKWYCLNDDPNASLDLLPLHTEAHIASFVERIKKNNFQHVEQVFVEHIDPTEFQYLPNDVMQLGEKMVQKVVYLLALENPMATVDEAIKRVCFMMGIPVGRSKMERSLNEAKEKVAVFRYSRVDP